MGLIAEHISGPGTHGSLLTDLVKSNGWSEYIGFTIVQVTYMDDEVWEDYYIVHRNETMSWLTEGGRKLPIASMTFNEALNSENVALLNETYRVIYMIGE